MKRVVKLLMCYCLMCIACSKTTNLEVDCNTPVTITVSAEMPECKSFFLYDNQEGVYKPRWSGNEKISAYFYCPAEVCEKVITLTPQIGSDGRVISFTGVLNYPFDNDAPLDFDIIAYAYSTFSAPYGTNFPDKIDMSYFSLGEIYPEPGILDTQRDLLVAKKSGITISRSTANLSLDLPFKRVNTLLGFKMHPESRLPDPISTEDRVSAIHLEVITKYPQYSWESRYGFDMLTAYYDLKEDKVSFKQNSMIPSISSSSDFGARFYYGFPKLSESEIWVSMPEFTLLPDYTMELTYEFLGGKTLTKKISGVERTFRRGELTKVNVHLDDAVVNNEGVPLSVFHLSAPGEFAEKVTDVNKVRVLYIDGPINGTDINMLSKCSNLEFLDLSNAQIRKGGSEYSRNGLSYSTRTDVVGYSMFGYSFGSGLFPRLETVVLPLSTKEIESIAFSSSKVRHIVIPESVRKMGDSVFATSGIEDAEFLCADLESMGTGIFAGCKSLNWVRLPDRMKTIPDKTFSESWLKSIELPESLESIGAYAFNECVKLESIELPASVKSLGDYAFCGCRLIKAIEISEGVEDIPYACFKGCYSLKTLVLPSTVKSIQRNAIAEVESLTCKALTPPTLTKWAYEQVSVTKVKFIYVPSESLAAYKSAWSGTGATFLPIE